MDPELQADFDHAAQAIENEHGQWDNPRYEALRRGPIRLRLYVHDAATARALQAISGYPVVDLSAPTRS